MPYTVEHNPLMGLVEVSYVGLTTGDDLREATSKAISLGKQGDTWKFLVEASGMDFVASIIDVFDLCAKQYDNEKLNRQSQIAVILPTSVEGREAAHFYETVCTNRGWSVRLFSERQSAINWLTGTMASHRQNEESA